MQSAVRLIVTATLLAIFGSSRAQDAGCPCLTEHALPKDADGKVTFTDPGGSEHEYPGDYGLSTCSKWDELLPPYCAEFVTADEAYQPRLAAPSWCELSWCYVDPTNCNQADVTKTYIFERDIRLAESELYYSYNTCGSSADEFAKWSRSGGLEAENLVQVVEDYLVTEVKPLAETTLDELLSLSSAECDDGWVNSCGCATCRLRTEAGSGWGTNEIDLGLTSVTVSSAVDLSQQSLSCNAKIVGRKYRNIVKSEYDDASRVAYLYFAKQSDGGYFQWPAIDWCPTDYDPRFRPWYASAVSGPKDVVLVIDKSGSMADDERMARANEAASTVLDTLTEFDSAAVVFFDDSAYASSASLQQMTDANVQVLKAYVTETGRPGGGTNFDEAFTEAFRLLRGGGGSGCQKIILFLTDGQDTSDLSLDKFEDEAWNADGAVSVFSYVIGGDSEELVRKPARIACQNGGKYFVITNLDQIKDTMADYFRFFANAAAPDTVRWIRYADAITEEELISGCLSIYNSGEVFGVACMDINVIISLANLRSKSTFAAFQTKMDELSTLCRPFSLTEADLVRLRAGSSCDDYSAASVTGASVTGAGLLSALFSLAVAGSIRWWA